MNLSVALVSIALSVSMLSAQTPVSKPARASTSTWSITTNVDHISDEKTKTLIVRSVDGRASLQVACNDARDYVVLFTAPRGIQVTNPTMLELRFDGDQAAGYLIETLDLAPLVASLGGSRTDQNYVIGLALPVTKLEKSMISAAAATLTAKMRTASKLIYRISLAQVGSPGVEGSFPVSGFDRVERTVGWRCGS
jgi:hypothetical protein